MDERARDEAGERPPVTHAFVVTLWCVDGGAVWRGHITHVASGQRGSIASLGQLNDFIAIYLAESGARPPLCWRIYRWLDRMWRYR